MAVTPAGNRLHIGIFGRKNAGKSSLLNALYEQEAALISDEPGTTLKPFYLEMNLTPVGPVVMIDTPGFDDNGTEAGQNCNMKIKEVMDQTDLALLLFYDTNEDYAVELTWYKELINRKIPVLGVINRMDDRFVDLQPIKVQFGDITLVKVSATKKINLNRIRESIRRVYGCACERNA